MLYLRDMSLLEWNVQEIAYARLPFGEYGTVIYEQ
jgi:hypothetical protein